MIVGGFFVLGSLVGADFYWGRPNRVPPTQPWGPISRIVGGVVGVLLIALGLLLHAR